MDLSQLTPAQRQQVIDKLQKFDPSLVKKELILPPGVRSSPPVHALNTPKDPATPAVPLLTPKGQAKLASVEEKWNLRASQAYEVAETIAPPQQGTLLRDEKIDFRSLKSLDKREVLEAMDEALDGGEMLRRNLDPNREDENE